MPERSPRAPSPAPDRRRVLVIEDDPDIAEAITYQLERAGMAVKVARTGEEGLEGVRRGADLVLLDLNLPKKDGRQVLLEIKADPDLRRIPVIVLTTSAAERDVLQAYDQHVNAYVRKPVGYTALLDVVRSIQDFWIGAALLPPREPAVAPGDAVAETG